MLPLLFDLFSFRFIGQTVQLFKTHRKVAKGAFFFDPPSIRLVHVLFAHSKSILERAKKLISRNVSCVNTLNSIQYWLSDRDKEIISGASSGLNSS